MDKKKLAWKESFLALFESLSDGAFILDYQGRIQEVNPSLCAGLGYARQEMCGLSFASLMADMPAEIDFPSGFMGQPGKACALRMKNGQVFHTSLRLQTLPDETCLGMLTANPQTDAERSSQVAPICIDRAPIAIFRVDQRARVIEVNDQACKSLGYSRAELCRLSLADIEPDFDPDFWQSHRQSLYAAGARTIEGTHKRKDGSLFPVEVMVSYFKIGDEQYSYSFVTDISERKHTEEALKRLIRINEGSMRLVKMGSWEYDVIKGLFTFNDQFYDLYGASAAEVGGYQLSAAEYTRRWVTPDDAHLIEDSIRLAVESRDPDFQYETEVHIVRSDGAARDAMIWFQIEKDAQGKTVALHGVHQDITSRKKTERDLRQAYDLSIQLEQIVNRSPAIAFLWRAAEGWPVEYVSDSVCQLGYTPLEFYTGKIQYIDLIHPDDLERVKTELHQYVREGRLQFSQEYRVVTSSGEIRRVDDRTWVRYDSTGNPTHYEGIVMDITQRSQVEAALRESEQKFRFVVQNVQAIIFVIDRDGKFLLSEGRGLEKLGLAPNQVVGESIYDVFKDEPAALANVQAALKGELTRSNDIINGLYSEVVYSPYVDAQGQINGVLGVSIDITERIKAEEALQESEFFLRKSQSVAKIGSYRLNVKTGGWICSPELDDIFGIDEGFPKDITGWNHLMHSDQQDELISYLNRHVIAGKNRFDKEYRIIRQDTGEECWVHGLGELEFDQDGNTIAMIGTIQDITQRKLIAGILEQTNATLRALIESSPLAIIAIDLNGLITLWNPAAERVYGWSEEEVFGKVLPFIPGTKTEEYDWVREQSMQGRSLTNVEFCRRRKDGSPVDISLSTAPLKDSDGKVLGIISVSTDIGKRKRAERLLQALNAASLSMQRALTPADIFKSVSIELKKIDLTCVIFEADRELATLSPVFLTYSGEVIQALEKLTGLNARGFLLPVKSIEELNKTIHGRQTIYIDKPQKIIREILPRLVAGLAESVANILHISKIIHAPLIIEGRVIGLFSVESDSLEEDDVPAVTAFAHQLAAAWRQTQLLEQAGQEIFARKQAETQVRQLNQELEGRVKERTAQLEAANKELEAFSYSVSHDLRAPLRVIDGYAAILLEDYETLLDAEGKRICTIIRTGTQRMSQLIDDLLSFSRIGRAEMKNTLIDMVQQVNLCYDELTGPEEKKRISLTIKDLPSISGDANMIRQVWVNLISNAIKFSSKREQAQIEIGSKMEGEQIIYYVCDNGAGFDSAYADKLFGVFQRLHNDRDYPGTGVGLAIVQRIVHRHGGRIWAESHPDQGATFYFSLPN